MSTDKTATYRLVAARVRRETSARAFARRLGTWRQLPFPALLLAACGAAPSLDNVTAPTTVASGWNPVDACATLGSDAAAAASRSPVRSAELTTVVRGTPATAAFSMCTFRLANGATLMLLTREAPSGDATAAAIEAARTAGGTMPPAVDVPGLGRAALWNEALDGLQVFLDDRRYLSINYSGLPDGSDAKALAIAVAKKLP